MYRNLINVIQSKGVKKTVLARKLGISGTTLDNKLSGRTRFYVDEAQVIVDVLGLDERLLRFYFTQNV